MRALIGVTQQQARHNILVYEDLQFIGVGATSDSPDVATPAYTSVASGYALLLDVGTKTQTPIVDTPSGWQRVGEYIATTSGNGTNVGPVRKTLFFRESNGVESGTQLVTADGGNSTMAAMYAFSKDARANWDITVTGGAHIVGATADFSCTSYSPVDSEPGDIILVLVSTNNTLYTNSGQTLTQTGVTFDVIDDEILDVGGAAGNNQWMVSSAYRVASGVGTTAMTYEMTSSGSAAASPLGICAFVRLRQSHTESLPVSGYREWIGADILAVGSPVDAGPVFDGNRASFQGPDAGTARYFVETFNGRPCMKIVANLNTGLNRRTEFATVPWAPTLVVGTQLIKEIRYETDSTVDGQCLGGWIMGQNHTGTAPGGPWPANHPLFYYGWSYAGEGGWDNTGGTSVGGEFSIINKVSGTRHLISTVTYAPDEVYRVRTHVKFDYAGDACLKTWINDVLVFENYVDATIPTTDAELGSVANVGGTQKEGAYIYSVEDAGDVSANIAAGFEGVTLFVPAIKQILLHPTDTNYITDLTQNDNPLYARVNTSTN